MTMSPSHGAIPEVKRYRPDPKNPRRLTDEEQRRLDEAPIDYSDIPELGDEFFTKACVVTGEIPWSKCPDVESVPGRCSGAWVARDSRVIVEGILENAEDASPEEVADMFELPVEQVWKVLLFAYQSELNSLAEAHRKRPNLPRAYYYRAGLLVKNVAEIARALRPRPTRKGGTTMTAAMADPELILHRAHLRPL